MEGKCPSLVRCSQITIPRSRNNLRCHLSRKEAAPPSCCYRGFPLFPRFVEPRMYIGPRDLSHIRINFSQRNIFPLSDWRGNEDRRYPILIGQEIFDTRSNLSFTCSIFFPICASTNSRIVDCSFGFVALDVNFIPRFSLAFFVFLNKAIILHQIKARVSKYH